MKKSYQIIHLSSNGKVGICYLSLKSWTEGLDQESFENHQIYGGCGNMVTIALVDDE